MHQSFANATAALINFFFLFTVFVTNGSTVYAEVAGPGWITQTAPLVSPEEAEAYYGSIATVSTVSASSLSTASVTTISDPEITELARALQNDPTLIYEYVLNHIDYAPYYGHLKDATLTLLERSGNDFDQAELLISLLRAAGHTAVFVNGTMSIPTMNASDQRDMAHWLDVSPTAKLFMIKTQHKSMEYN